MASRKKVKRGKLGTGKKNRVGKLKVETFSLLISILIHLGLLAAPIFLSPPKSVKYVKSIKVDYIISLPKINHHLRESSGKSIISPLTIAFKRKNRELLKPSSIRTIKPSISSNLRSQERILSPEETSNHRKRKSLSLFSPPTKVRESTMESNPLREGTSKMVSKIAGVNLSIDKASILSSFSPLTRVRKFPLLRKIEASVYLAREENLSQKRLADHTPSLATEPVGLNQTLPLRQREGSLAFLGLPFEEKKLEPMPGSYSPTERNLNPFPMRQSEKNYPHHQILPSSLDPIVQPGIRGHSPIIKEKKFSPLTTEPDSHREEIRTLKEDAEHLTESLWLREYAQKIRKLINANKKYPPVARQHGWKGRIKVRFTINSGGEVIKTEVSSPCSYEVLNRAAEKLIKDTSPFPPFPSSWQKNSLTVELQIV
ncbi:energy transducer TonB, partial [Candidatus Aerophobetes bacterium]|nr:energy transducer TonB [Candidatus Aerophobetes bacterium]